MGQDGLFRPIRGHTQRVSFIWVDDDGWPCIADDENGNPFTLVALWTTDKRGFIDTQAITNVTILRWNINRMTADMVGEMIEMWPTAKHDYLVEIDYTGNLSILPCWESIPALAAQSDNGQEVCRALQLRTKAALGGPTATQ